MLSRVQNGMQDCAVIVIASSKGPANNDAYRKQLIQPTITMPRAFAQTDVRWQEV